MGRGSVSNIDLSRRLRQFIFLIVVTALGMLVSVAFFGKSGKGLTGVHASGSVVTASF